MVYYDYVCEKHGNFELEKDEEPKCPVCGEVMKRIFTVIKFLNPPTGACKEE